MKKLLTLAAVAAFALSCGSAMAEFKDFSVNGTTVSKTTQELLAKQVIASMGNPQAQVTPELEDQVRTMMVQMTVLSQYAKERKIDQQPEVKKELAFNADLVLMRLAVDSFVKAHPVTDADVQAEYKREKDQWGTTEYKVEHILVSSEQEAKDLIAQLKKGADFAKLAKDKSKDESSKVDGGMLDWNSPTAFPGEFAKAVKSLKKGELDNEPVQTIYGWHVVKVVDTRPASLFPSLEERKANIQQTLEKKRAADFVQSLVSSAKVVK